MCVATTISQVADLRGHVISWSRPHSLKTLQVCHMQVCHMHMHVVTSIHKQHHATHHIIINTRTIVQ